MKICFSWWNENLMNTNLENRDKKIQDNLRKKLIDWEITPEQFFSKHKKRTKIFKEYLFDNLEKCYIK